LENFIVGLRGLEFRLEMSAGGGFGSVEPVPAFAAELTKGPVTELDLDVGIGAGGAGGCLVGMLTLVVSVGLSGVDSAGEALKSEPILKPLRCRAWLKELFCTRGECVAGLSSPRALMGLPLLLRRLA
jgi:hypothetical protein